MHKQWRSVTGDTDEPHSFLTWPMGITSLNLDTGVTRSNLPHTDDTSDDESVRRREEADHRSRSG